MWSKPCEKYLHIAKRYLGWVNNSSGKTLHDNMIIKIEAGTADEFVQRNSAHTLDFIKMDIEDGEEEAILGMKNVMRGLRPVVIIECHSQESLNFCTTKIMEFDYAVKKFYGASSNKANYPLALPREKVQNRVVCNG
jgi:hypothetical protein